ncbi:hypothetical protein [Alicyclobacillus fodiniaquatilis]|uniref:Uncharacterized protein n=1 Tax=Alicyclobacillus fodiniaquatilis TaxID=1661150 RepID=A0ABW4JJK7_9BACL
MEIITDYMLVYNSEEATHINKQAELLKKAIEERWNGKVYPNECSTAEYDIHRGFKISTASKRGGCIWTHCDIEVLRDMEILIWTNAENAYKRLNHE